MSRDPEQQTRCWLQNVIIKLNFCPFAQREFVNERIHYATDDSSRIEHALQRLADELAFLQKHPEYETSLLIFSSGFTEFDDFLDLIDIANQLVDELNFSGTFQLAHFHPEYRFEGETNDDPANFTNRSPFPTLHLLREESLQAAIASHPDTSIIPDNNIKLARTEGFDKMQALLDHCKK